MIKYPFNLLIIDSDTSLTDCGLLPSELALEDSVVVVAVEVVVVAVLVVKLDR